MKSLKTGTHTHVGGPQDLLRTPVGVRSTEIEGRRMLISQIKMKDVLVRRHALPDGDWALGKVRYFNKINFPRAFETARGSRTSMTLEDLLKFAVAFELLIMGLGNQFLAEGIQARWSDISEIIAEHWDARSSGRDAPDLILVSGHAYRGERQVAPGQPTLSFRSASSEPASNVRDWMVQGAVFIIDVRALVDEIAEAVRQELVATVETFQHEMDLFVAEVFGEESAKRADEVSHRAD